MYFHLVFSYIWHLYLTAFCNQVDSQRSRILANTFRVIQAFSSSIPLILVNFYVILSIMKIPDSDALDLSRLTCHLQEGINGNCP